MQLEGIFRILFSLILREILYKSQYSAHFTYKKDIYFINNISRKSFYVNISK